ncbi:MAG: homoserine O-acetyltransferase [Rikenellaceae bacterium]|jgi:homoserine O-acetyltransferase|nr:homoserine O-acetyltransferase [Rikenellaceae bacterium]
MEAKIYRHTGSFELESGEVLPELVIAYHTFGERQTGENNVLWVCHALTANSDVEDWWPGTVEDGRFLDPARYFTVCANIVGSPYGTTSPMSVNPATGERWYGTFPFVTMRDMARANLLLADHLGISRVRAVIGGSIGGFQAMEMELLRPGFAERLVVAVCGAKTTPWDIALNESHRMAIRADQTFGERRKDAARAGLAAARSIALLSYRGSLAYNATQQDPDDTLKRDTYRAASYQRYQGEKFVRRFDAYSYLAIIDAFDTHDVGRGRGGCEVALAQISCPTMVIGITTDIIIPVIEQEFLHRHIPRATLSIIESDFGHDGFLVESSKLNEIIKPFIER